MSISKYIYKKLNSGKYGYLAKNTIIFTLGVLGSKLLNFFLVPFYANVLSKKEYGTADFIINTSGLLLYAVTLCMGEAVFLFVIKKEDDPIDILNIGLKHVLCYGCIICSIILFLKILNIISIACYLVIFLCLHLLLSSFLNVINFYLQATDKIKNVAISSVILTFVTVFCNIIFILLLKLRLVGYFLAVIIGLLCSLLYSVYECDIFGKIAPQNKKSLYRKMIIYSFPLVINGLAWWVNSSLDRFFIIRIVGFSANGIYSSASMIPNILTTISTTFLQAWAISAIKEYNKDDSDGFMGNIYSICNFLFVIICSILLVMNRFLSSFLLPETYFSAWKSASFLLVSVIFSSMSSLVGSVFSAVKNNRAYAISTIIAAIVNVIFNALLIPSFAEVGAAIATMVSFFVVFLVRYYLSQKYINWNNIFIRDMVSYIVIIIQAFVILFYKNLGLQLICVVICVVLYIDVISVIVKKVNRL